MPSSLCLNMIVKDEAPVIRRCLAAVKPLISHWVIVDTGSSDGTQDIIRECLADLPGKLHERPWRDFGHNRSEALTLAQGQADYLFVIDADERLWLPEGFVMPTLEADAYYLEMQYTELRYSRLCLFSSRLRWRYVGVLHEFPEADGPIHSQHIEGPKVLVGSDGARSRSCDPATKYANDARVLEQALRTEPENARYMFYLAQSYRDSGQLQAAIDTYLRRVAMGGWAEEVWYALYQIARLSELLGRDQTEVAQAYLAAYQFRPCRAEPLVNLARFHRERHQFALAHLYAERAVGLPPPSDILFVEVDCYGWRALDEYAVAAYWTDDFRACEQTCRRLLASPALPHSEAERVSQNLEFAVAKLAD
ncbi:MAG: glycosyltransferase family 2 protein [Methylococcus sp.]|nr:glycosyltransferase family 2 protein [Methylococcus sp.]